MHCGGCGLRLPLQPTNPKFSDRRAQPRTGQADSQRHSQDEGRAATLMLAVFRKGDFLFGKITGNHVIFREELSQALAWMFVKQSTWRFGLKWRKTNS